MTRLLGVQLAAQETRLLTATADIIGEHVGVLRGEIAQERDSRTVDVQRLEARVAALESRLAPRDEPSEIDKTLCVVGGYGKLAKSAACDKVRNAMAAVDGFVDVVSERVSNVPRVVIGRFDSLQKLDNFVRGHKDVEAFTGLWAAPNRSLEERQKFRPLFKIKRAIIEGTGCQGDQVVVDKPSRSVYTVGPRGELRDAAVLTSSAQITWSDVVDQSIRDVATTLIAE